MDKKVDISHPKVVTGMRAVSKAVIFVPLILLLLAVIFHFYSQFQERQRAQLAESRRAQLRLQQERQASMTALMQPAEEYDINIDINGTYQCEYTDGEATASGRIEGGNISFEMKNASESAFIVTDEDCLYIWDETNQGQKTCGLAQYRELATLFSSFGVFDTSSIITTVTSSIESPVSTDSAFIPKTLEQCREATASGQLLTIPQNIRFLEQSLDEATQGNTNGGVEDVMKMLQ